jgi:hypothetical protein
MPNYTVSSNLSFDISYSVNAPYSQDAEASFYDNLNNLTNQLNAFFEENNIESYSLLDLSTVQVHQEPDSSSANSGYTSMASLIAAQNTAPAPIEESNSSYTRLVRR